MNKYQVTINLVVEVQARTEEDACRDALNSVDYHHGDVLEDNVTDVEVIEFRCAECDAELDLSDYYDDDSPALCPDCNKKDVGFSCYCGAPECLLCGADDDESVCADCHEPEPSDGWAEEAPNFRLCHDCATEREV